MFRKMIPGILAVVCLLAVAFASIAQEMTLKADSLDYDPARGTVRATGNVILSRDGVVLTAPHGEGTIEGKDFHLWGKVRGTWEEKGIELDADDVIFQDADKGFLVAKGKVRLRTGADVLEAEDLTWDLADEDTYRASGGVLGQLGQRHFQAASFEREGEKFTVREMTELVDPELGARVSAPLVEGTISGEEIETLEASGGVVIQADQNKNGPVRVTGQKALYSKVRGTLVVSGKARAVQKDRIISADSIVLHSDTGRMEALGNPRLTFPLSGEDNR